MTNTNSTFPSANDSDAQPHEELSLLELDQVTGGKLPTLSQLFWGAVFGVEPRYLSV